MLGGVGKGQGTCEQAGWRWQSEPLLGWLQEKFKKLKKEYGSKKLGDVTVEQAIGGMRGIPVSAVHCGRASRAARGVGGQSGQGGG